MALHGDNLAAKADLAAIVSEEWFHNADEVRMFIA